MSVTTDKPKHPVAVAFFALPCSIVPSTMRRAWFDGFFGDCQPLNWPTEACELFAATHALIDVVRVIESTHHHPVGWWYVATEAETTEFIEASALLARAEVEIKSLAAITPALRRVIV